MIIVLSLFDLIIWGQVFLYQVMEWYSIEKRFDSKSYQSSTKFFEETNHYEIDAYDEKDISFNADGSIDATYYIDSFEAERHEELQETSEVAEQISIEGTEAESLFMNLQSDLGIDNSDAVEGNEEVTEVDKEVSSLKEKLTELATVEGTENLPETIRTLHSLYEVEGRTEEMNVLQETFSDYFFDSSLEQENQINDDYFPPLNDNDIPPFEIDEDDILSFDEGKQELENSHLVVPKLFTDNFATAQISNQLLGEQVWVGLVVGKERNYIHFADSSSRIWLDIGNKAKRCNLNDLLVIRVERDEESIVTKGAIMKIKDKELALNELAK